MIYLRRRFTRVAPIAIAIALVTMLLVCVITPTNTFDETTRANVAGLRAFTVIAPARQAELDHSWKGRLEHDPSIEALVPVRALWVRHPMVIGEAYCPLLLADAARVREIAERAGLRLVAGRYPDDDHPGVALHEDVARARKLSVGRRFGTWVDPDDTTPGAYIVQGLLGGDARLAVGTTGTGLFQSFLSARAPAYLLLYPRPGAKARMDAMLRDARVGGEPAFQVIDEAYMNERARKALANVPVLVNFTALATSIVVALVVALLAVVGFQARQEEFALRLAIGQRRSHLLLELALESGVLALSSWMIGIVVGWLVLYAYDVLVFEPRGFLVRLLDARPLVASSMLPLVSVLASVTALGARLYRMDPVAILQRHE
jgi:hypothetical protein